ncbi:MAG: hypothetical protein ACFB22_03930 [Rhodothalassiaceae bacterium]
MLNCVRWLDDGRIIAAGARGTIVEGRGMAWRVIDQIDVEDEIWAVESLQGQVWFATDDALYRLEAGDRLVRVEVGVDALTAGFLHQKDGLMLSVGRKHLLYTLNGTSWTLFS